MKRALIITSCLAMCLFGIVVAVNAETTGDKTIIRVKGSDDVAGRIDSLAKIFMEDNPQTSVVVSSGSRGVGFTDLVGGQCEVVMSGHQLTDEEKQLSQGKQVQIAERLIGYGGLVILTYPQNTVNELTVDQLAKLIKGEHTSWDQVGGPPDPVVFIGLEPVSSDIEKFIFHDLLGTWDVKSRIERANSLAGIAKKVGETKGALGYCRIRDIEGKHNSSVAMVLKIKKDASSPAVMPTRGSVEDKTYPIIRPFFLCTDSKANKEVKRFVDFIEGKGLPGQGH